MATQHKFPTFQGHGLGALRQHVDPRDHLYADSQNGLGHDEKKLSVPLPDQATVAMDAKVPILNQGNLGSCTANEGAAHYSILQMVENKTFTPLSRLQIYYDARVLLNKRYANQDSGATGRAVAKTLATAGACPETTWPYKIGKFRQEPPDICASQGLDHQLIEYLAIQSQDADTLTLIRTSLAAGYPVGFSFMVYSNFEPDGDGLIPMPKGTIEGGHRMMLVGYKTVNGERRYLGRNSWGQGWGQRGRCWFHEDHVYQFMSDFWTYRTVE